MTRDEIMKLEGAELGRAVMRTLPNASTLSDDEIDAYCDSFNVPRPSQSRDAIIGFVLERGSGDMTFREAFCAEMELYECLMSHVPGKWAGFTAPADVLCRAFLLAVKECGE